MKIRWIHFIWKNASPMTKEPLRQRTWESIKKVLTFTHAHTHSIASVFEWIENNWSNKTVVEHKNELSKKEERSSYMIFLNVFKLQNYWKHFSGKRFKDYSFTINFNLKLIRYHAKKKTNTYLKNLFLVTFRQEENKEKIKWKKKLVSLDLDATIFLLILRH